MELQVHINREVSDSILSPDNFYSDVGALEIIHPKAITTNTNSRNAIPSYGLLTHSKPRKWWVPHKDNFNHKLGGRCDRPGARSPECREVLSAAKF